MDIQMRTPKSRTFLMFLGLLLASSLRATDPMEATITTPTSAVSVATNSAMTFAASSSDSLGSDVYITNSYSWSFGDGATGSGASTTHAYTAAGTYTATLTVSFTRKNCIRMDTNGNCTSYQSTTGSASASRTITVTPPPSITSFTASKTSNEAGKPVTLSWVTANATSVTISGVTATLTPGTSSTTVSPTVTTTYTLTAAGTGAPASASVTVSTYTIAVGITPGTKSLALGGTQVFTATVSPANMGVSWSCTGGSLAVGTGSAGTYTNTFTASAKGGPFTVKVASLEDAARTASATVTVQIVNVATPVPIPSTGRAFVGGTVTFSALVSGAVNTGVTWSVNGGGTISSSGVFTAGAQTFTNGQGNAWIVTATSQADPTKKATATVTVVPVTVTVTPPGNPNVVVRSGQTQAFSAAVAAGVGTPSQAVTWSVDGITGGSTTLGTITTAGVYTAPATAGNHSIKATSVQDTGCSDSSPVRVPGWVLHWKRDILYAGTKEIAEVDAVGMHVTMTDHLGSPRFLVGPTGALESEQKYLPFGDLLTDSASTAKFAKGFTNHEQTDPSGLIYMQARFYAPWYGRFLSPDPARDQHFEETQSWNIYSYVQNNPVMLIDPTGMLTDAADKQKKEEAKKKREEEKQKKKEEQQKKREEARKHRIEEWQKHHTKLTDEQVTNIIFNELRSIDGMDIDAALRDIANATLNGDNASFDEAHPRPDTAKDSANVPGVEVGRYEDSKKATEAARSDQKKGTDPTGGAQHFNLRNGKSRKDFQGHKIKTQRGPFNNSFPTRDLKGSNIYVNTYE